MRFICLFLSCSLVAGCSAVDRAESTENEINIIDAGEYADALKPAETLRSEPAATTTATTTVATATTAATTTAATTTAATTTAATTTAATTTVATTTAATTTVATTTAQTIPAERPTDFGTNSYTALNYDEIHGVWISYLEYTDMMTGRSEQQFRTAIAEAFENCVDLGLNTVFVHARSHGDAYYQSELFPWSRYASGSINVAPDYDPLAVIIEEAHARQLSVQAWINPLRMCSVADMASYGEYAAAQWYSDSSTADKYIVEVSGYYYLNPAYDEVVELIADGAEEIVANYDVDGLHIDDYFYPTTEAWFDSAAFAESGSMSLAEFRFDNCDRLVESLYDAVKSANNTALFSVSCQGSIENNYDKMYADVEKWCTQSGYLDYIVPQIYYGFENSTQPYLECLSRWEDMTARGGIPLVAGLSVYKLGVEDTWAGEGKTEWITDSAILARQLEAARECTSYGGTALYSYRSIFSCDSSVKEQIWDEIAEYTALIN